MDVPSMLGGDDIICSGVNMNNTLKAFISVHVAGAVAIGFAFAVFYITSDFQPLDWRLNMVLYAGGLFGAAWLWWQVVKRLLRHPNG